ncbi:bifunctional phosphoribosylaminoimidazole carboxylase/phosphoribosylaminoimidazole succinocarboxamide synthetase [Mantella aurantiaca]
MERAAPWTEPEVRALIAIWSEESIKRQLQGTLRNKGLFMYIALRMRQLGIFRDWKQCRSKYKNLKYEYRALRSSTREPVHKIPFYDELHAILGSESAVHAGNEAGMDEDMCPVRAADLQSPEGGTSDLLIVPAVHNEGGKHWSSRETLALINIWSDKSIRGQLKGTVRNQKIFEHIASLLQQAGIDRDWRQCRTKYKNLKHEYAVVKKAHDSGNRWKTMKYFKELDTILSGKPSGYRKINNDKPSSLPCPRPVPATVAAVAADCLSGHISEIPEGSPVAHKTPNIKQELNTSGQCHERGEYDLPNRENAVPIHIKEESSSVDDNPEMDDDNDFRIVTGNDTGGGRNWSDYEVQSLLHVWSDEKISQRLDGTFRNKQVFEEISLRLMEFGINRDWKQCRRKYKNLKYEYHCIQKDENNENQRTMRQTGKFFDQIDRILRHLPKLSGHAAEHEPPGAIPIRAICQEESRTVSGAQNLSEEESNQVLTAQLKRKASPKDLHCPDQKKHVWIHSPTKHPSCDHAAGNICENPSVRTLSSPSLSHESPWEPQPTDGVLREPGINDQWWSGASVVRTSALGEVCGVWRKMETSTELTGRKINEGKTKEVYELPDHPGCVLMQSKDQITAGNAARKDHMEGKASISNKTTSCIFKLLQEAGIKTAFVKKCSATGFIATHCEMVPIEWVCRRIATGSFLKRNPGVKEGYKFYPPKVEIFFKDDANNDPQWSEEQLIATKLTCAGLVIGQAEVDIMQHSTVAIFEILEKAWSTQDCTLVDMKIEFGVDVTKKEIVLADVIDNDSWRLWPSGDKSQQKDKQTYRDLKEITPEAMQMVKRNFEWVAERVELLLTSFSQGRVVVLMGSISDLVHCEKIKKSCANYGIPCELRVTSAHKGPDETLRIKSEYEGDGIPTVFVAVAGRSNGLGPVLSGNTAYPVINCPPLTADWGAQDVWSSLRMPSGLGCSTVLSPEAAAQFAAQIFGLSNHLIWSKLRSCTLNTWISLKQADVKLRECSM